jgi:hypothetical protein
MACVLRPTVQELKQIRDGFALNFVVLKTSVSTRIVESLLPSVLQLLDAI